MAATIEPIERGLFRRKDPVTGTVYAPIWMRFQNGKKTEQEPTGTAKVAEARIIRAQRIAQVASGMPLPNRTATVGDLLDRLVEHHEAHASACLATVKGHVKALKKALGDIRAKELDSDRITAMQRAWQAEHRIQNATINRICGTLRRAYTLARRKGTIAHVPFIDMLPDQSRRGLYIKGADHAALTEHLPDYVALVLEFARLFGTRRGQLCRTLRAWVDRARGIITWPPTETKGGEAHSIPLDERGLALVDRALAQGADRPWCPYLFHGPFCAPGRTPNRKYGCVGDFRYAWAKACRAAGLPVGRKAGGYVFHHTRNTAVTDMLATGQLSITEAMVISNHKTESMIRHYNLGNVEALRERLARSREEIDRLTAREGGR